MKRSTMVFLGALGLVGGGWAIERQMRPVCPPGPDGKPIASPDCRMPSSGSSSSSSRTYYSSSGSSGSSSGSWGTAGSAPSGGVATSSGGFGGFARGFSSGS